MPGLVWSGLQLMATVRGYYTCARLDGDVLEQPIHAIRLPDESKDLVNTCKRSLASLHMEPAPSTSAWPQTLGKLGEASCVTSA